MSLVGDDLADFLIERHVTALCCVPTLLATIEKDLPELRILLVSGEACPQNLVVRWHRAGPHHPQRLWADRSHGHGDADGALPRQAGDHRRTAADLHDRHSRRERERGDRATAAWARSASPASDSRDGYLNRAGPDGSEVRSRFPRASRTIPRSASIAPATSAASTRTDEVEFHGRIDTQVKIRGYRIELDGNRIGADAELPQIAQAVVHTYEPEPGTVELVAYYTLEGRCRRDLSPRESGARRCALQLPAYMVPAYFEKLAIIPMTASNKADRKALPPPTGTRARRWQQHSA